MFLSTCSGRPPCAAAPRGRPCVAVRVTHLSDVPVLDVPAARRPKHVAVRPKRVGHSPCQALRAVNDD